MTFPDAKQAIRSALKAQRHAFAASLAPATRDALEQALGNALAPLFATTGSIAAYAPMKDEISPLPAIRRAEAAHLTPAFPYFVDRDAPMTFRAGHPESPGPWGILQPDGDAPLVAPDLVLMPLVAVDGRGNRIGMGKGHYDRALPGLRAAGTRLIGIGWSFQRIEDKIEPDAWDVALDGFASPDGLEMF